jgi:hypothetical protein
MKSLEEGATWRTLQNGSNNRIDYIEEEGEAESTSAWVDQYRS